MKHSHLLFVLVLAVPLFAQTTPTTQPQHTDEIVVTASALPESVETTPATATIVTRQEIEAREARDVADVLREVPGVTVSRTGSQGKAVSLFIRGGSSKQALVLWNGIEINNAYFSAYNLGQMSAAGVEKVEVVRGPYSALYGADAMSGVVNVLTTPSRSNATVDVAAGEQGLFNGAFSGALVRDAWNAHGAVEQRQDDGFAPNDDFDSTSILGGATFAPVDRFSLGVVGRFSSYDLGIPRNANGSATEFVPTPRRREDGEEMHIAIPILFDAGPVSYSLRLSENHRDDHFEDPDAPFGAELADTDARTRTVLGSVRFATRFGAITAGAEVENSEATHTDTFGLDVDSRERDSRSFFVEDRLSHNLSGGGSIEVAAGLRHDEFDSFGSELSPRVAVAYVRNGSKWRAAYGEAFRAPAIGELYLPFFGNVDLEAERSSSFEIGYERWLPNGANFAITAFSGKYDNLIAFGASRFENIDEATTRGVELSAARRFDRLSFNASYTWLDTEDEATGEQLLRRPEHSGSFAIGYDFAPASIQFVVIHTGDRDDVTDLFPFGRVLNEAYTTVDFTARYQWGSLSPYVKLENLTDTNYEEVFGYPSAERRAVVGVRWSR